MSSSALSVFQSGNLAVNGRRDLFVLTSVSSSNGCTMMLVLTRRYDKNGRDPKKFPGSLRSESWKKKHDTRNFINFKSNE